MHKLDRYLFFPTKLDADAIAGTIVVTMGNNHDLTGYLSRVSMDKPAWLDQTPRNNYENYKVHVRTISCRYEAILHDAPETSGRQPDRVQVKIGNMVLESREHQFQTYTLEQMRESPWIFAADHLYITIPGTKKIYCIVIETELTYRNRQQVEQFLTRKYIQSR